MNTPSRRAPWSTTVSSAASAGAELRFRPRRASLTKKAGRTLSWRRPLRPAHRARRGDATANSVGSTRPGGRGRRARRGRSGRRAASITRRAHLARPSPCSWVATTTVVPVRSDPVDPAAMIPMDVSGSRLPVGSSGQQQRRVVDERAGDQTRAAARRPRADRGSCGKLCRRGPRVAGHVPAPCGADLLARLADHLQRVGDVVIDRAVSAAACSPGERRLPMLRRRWGHAAAGDIPSKSSGRRC